MSTMNKPLHVQVSGKKHQRNIVEYHAHIRSVREGTQVALPLSLHLTTMTHVL